jgi:hypothetical protein
MLGPAYPDHVCRRGLASRNVLRASNPLPSCSCTIAAGQSANEMDVAASSQYLDNYNLILSVLALSVLPRRDGGI